ncbi:Hypothetical predicted protein [Olea europaea subsp. europaea]|uniref:Transmembrane protein n=1 Tax=Olea europaea subsp. europaea TaxID=158383 RepID=A0A8S0PFX6_OLEEU|nr:Hypothetical predicted protein [Olea europaea subsp. europaea]
MTPTMNEWLMVVASMRGEDAAPNHNSVATFAPNHSNVMTYSSLTTLLWLGPTFTARRWVMVVEGGADLWSTMMILAVVLMMVVPTVDFVVVAMAVVIGWQW